MRADRELQPEFFFRNTSVTVLGAGESGQAAARWLVEKGADVLVTDMNPLHAWDSNFVTWCKDSGVALEAGRHGIEACAECDLMVVSPGIPSHSRPVKMALEAGVPVVNDLVLAACFWSGPLAAVTGTNGKTTTTLLLAHLLEHGKIPCVTAGNISPPLFSVMEKDDGRVVAVLEVSSFQLELLEQLSWKFPFPPPRFDVAVWLNLAPDHLDRHGDMATYGRCKAKVLELQDSHCHAVLNASDPAMSDWLGSGKGKRVLFGWEGDDSGRLGTVISADRTVIWMKEDLSNTAGQETHGVELKEWSLSGDHNLENLAAAMSAAILLGTPEHSIKDAIPKFRAPSHRFETVALIDGITYIDDSKATNAAATIRALKSLREPAVLIAGGMGKDEDYGSLAGIIHERAAASLMRGVVLMGRDAPLLQSAIEAAVSPAGTRSDLRVEVITLKESGDAAMKVAVERAASIARPGDCVLLSPACASFDLFDSYSHRGKVFRAEVNMLAASSVMSRGVLGGNG